MAEATEGGRVRGREGAAGEPPKKRGRPAKAMEEKEATKKAHKQREEKKKRTTNLRGISALLPLGGEILIDETQ